ncbi:MAG: hypothetical protein QOI64_250 [Solirubrobacteraceae bacterium]|jgi:hypothetical protein|nr:hypothetical protein [Solirubrobacteraceae bacterium]
MIGLAELHDLALGLPEAALQEHHGMPSFRVRGRIFATVPDGQHVRVMVDEGEIRACVAQDPAAFAEHWWGSRLACVVVDLRTVDGTQLAELLADAWRRKAPRTLVRELDGAP